MKVISARLIKQLRIQTGAGIVDCKNALIETKGDIDKSIDFLRKLGRVKALNKQSCITSHGSIFISGNKKRFAMLELNCETDFVSKEHNFISFGKDIVNNAIIIEKNDYISLKKLFEEKRIDLISKVNENIVIRRIAVLNGNNVNSYLHHNRIGVLLKTTSCNDMTLVKNIAMHIAASKPEYLRPDLIPSDIIEREYNIQLELASRSKKSEFIIEKIAKGRMTKFANERSLLGQAFILNPHKTVGDIIIENNIDIVSFIRFEIGEFISN
ncbi:MAG: translation elongation factor Ts [Buchnera aphidicola (Melaphis rhois)]